MALDFKAASLRAFNAMLGSSMYGDTLTFNGKSYSCIAPPIEYTKRMANANYEEQMPATFQMLATDFTASEIELKSVFAHNDSAFQVIAITRDNRDGSVELRANLKQ
jgi:hypothetical protein